jgi:hypothetical protein
MRRHKCFQGVVLIVTLSAIRSSHSGSATFSGRATSPKYRVDAVSGEVVSVEKETTAQQQAEKKQDEKK